MGDGSRPLAGDGHARPEQAGQFCHLLWGLLTEPVEPQGSDLQVVAERSNVIWRCPEPPPRIELGTYALRDSISFCTGAARVRRRACPRAGKCIGVQGCAGGLLPALLPEHGLGILRRELRQTGAFCLSTDRAIASFR